MQFQRVAYIVQPHRMADLRTYHRNDMAPRRERARLFIHSGFTRDLRHRVRWNQFAYLLESYTLFLARSGLSSFFHPCLPGSLNQALRATSPVFRFFLWDGPDLRSEILDRKGVLRMI